MAVYLTLTVSGLPGPQNPFAFIEKCLQYKLFRKLMIIVLDRAIPYWAEAFAACGEIRLFSGSDLKPEMIRNADALIVRSVTPVRAPLLDDSSVRFVAAACAGIDHIDRNYLKQRRVAFAHAAGSNANAVSEYIVTALHVVAARRRWKLKSKSLGIIGVGNVGSLVAQKARALDMDVLLCDPPLRDRTGDTRYRSFDDVIKADILTFHVPLTREGPYPTWHLLDRRTLDRLAPGQFLINSSRGAVFDNRELKRALQKGKIAGAVLDVWEGEPGIDYSLLEWADIGTPHIAGTTLDGKIRATEMVHEECCRFFGRESSGSLEELYPDLRKIRPEKADADQKVILSVLRQVYDITVNDADLRALESLPRERAAESFERLRTHQVLRPEFPHFIVEIEEQQKHLKDIFTGLGFQVLESLKQSMKPKRLQYSKESIFKKYRLLSAVRGGTKTDTDSKRDRVCYLFNSGSCFNGRFVL
jgi:erythronate-4-phosphate dehydrogenase